MTDQTNDNPCDTDGVAHTFDLVLERIIDAPPETVFRAFAEPWFKRDSAWSFPATERFITIADIDCRCIAWFEEKLDSAHYGETRGSGVMRKTADGWKIEQYVLSFAVPNDRSDAVVDVIRSEGH